MKYNVYCEQVCEDCEERLEKFTCWRVPDYPDRYIQCQCKYTEKRNLFKLAPLNIIYEHTRQH